MGEINDSYIPAFMTTREIKALVLDFGGVVIDIDYQRTIDAFITLGFNDFDQWYTQFNQRDIFNQLECGIIDEHTFLSTLNEAVPHRTTDEIKAAWNAIIIGFPHGRVEYIQQLRKSMPVHLLSNTNALHAEVFNRMIQRRYQKQSVHQLFERTYLSHEVGMRKPGVEIFERVTKDLKLDPAEICFVDDLEKNVEGARGAGWHALQLNNIRDLPKLVGPLLTKLK